MCVDVCVCVCLSVCVQRKFNANSSKTVKTTNFKFDVDVFRDRPTSPLKTFSKRGRGQGHVTVEFFWHYPRTTNSEKVKVTDFKFATQLPITILSKQTWRRYELSWAPSSFSLHLCERGRWENNRHHSVSWSVWNVCPLLLLLLLQIDEMNF